MNEYEKHGGNNSVLAVRVLTDDGDGDDNGDGDGDGDSSEGGDSGSKMTRQVLILMTKHK